VLPRDSVLPRVYEWLKRTDAVSVPERLTTFNCGIGMIGAVRPKDAKGAIAVANRAGVEAWVVGEVTERERGFESEVVVHTDEGRFALTE
jgi:phosphoribosylformylglycinamidine cyclo-ligase